MDNIGCPGQAKRHPGSKHVRKWRPVRAEALFFIRYKMLLPLQGVNAINPRNPGCRFACPGLGAFGLSARALSAEKPCRKNGGFWTLYLTGWGWRIIIHWWSYQISCRKKCGFWTPYRMGVRLVHKTIGKRGSQIRHKIPWRLYVNVVCKQRNN